MALELLCLHWVGDYLLQSDSMAAHKLTSAKVRTLHVAAYTLPFALWLALTGQPAATVAALSAFIAITHYIIDSRRFTLGSRWAHRPVVLDQGFHLVTLLIVEKVILHFGG